MNLILIAPPAAGKGTMASRLNSEYGLVCISAGELLRGVDPSTELGKQIRDIQSRRELVLLDVSYDLALKRTLGRQICPNCKQTYNKLTGVNPPLVENMCNDCHVELTTRNDDNEETFKAGFLAYEKNCAPVIEYYRNKGILIELDASKSPEDTFKEFQEKIGSKKNEN